MINFEFKRLFNSRILYIVVFLSVCLGVLGMVSYFETSNWHKLAGNIDAVSAYDAWLYSLGVGPGALLKVIFPLLIALPFCDSYIRDRKSGYINFVISRGEYNKYIISKFLVSGVSGSLVSGITLIVLLVISFIIFPANLPNTPVNLNPQGIFGSFYSESPYMYVLLILLINLIFGFLYAMLGVASSAIFNNRFTATVFPFLFYLFLLISAQLLKIKVLFPIGLIAPFETGNTTIIEFITGYSVVIGLVVVFSFKLFSRKGENLLNVS